MPYNSLSLNTTARGEGQPSPSISSISNLLCSTLQLLENILFEELLVGFNSCIGRRRGR